MKRLPLIFGLMLLLSACEKDIEFNGEVTDPLMVVNAVVPTDSIIEIKITKSRFFMHVEDTFETVKNATVELYVNDVYAETMNHAGNGRYISNYRAHEGDIVRIVSQAPGLKTTTAEMHIVSAVNVVKLDTTITDYRKYPITNSIFDESKFKYVDDTIGWNCWCTINCKLTFSDNPGNENFYRLDVINKVFRDSVNYDSQRVWYQETDVVFGENNQSEFVTIDQGVNAYGTFTNELFKGKNYPLTFSLDVFFSYIEGENVPRSYDLSGETRFEIDLQTVNKSYYLYLMTSSNYVPDDLFAEPVQIHSNVMGGIGIIGNLSHNLIPLKLPL